MTRIKLRLYPTIAAVIAGLHISAAIPAAAAHLQNAQPTGLWINPAHSVKVVTAACGAALCGRIAWANNTAIDDAQAGGVAQLAGTEVLQDYHQTGPTTWQGRVLVPDMGRTFSSRLTLVDIDRLKVSGCVLGGLLCKSQVWTRAGQP